MGFGFFAIIGLIMAVVGITVVRQIVRHRRTIFDERFTDEDRAYVTQAAFFVLLPISVALHELGHAVMVWMFGGQVTSFGYYFFAGYVAYRGVLTDAQQILIAVAGVTVNVLLGTIALAVIFLKRPPLRAAYNELLLQFTIISVANALIFYPVLDLLSNLNGDFRQMYFGGVPWLSGIIFVCHAGILLGAYLASKNDRISARLAQLTGLPPNVHRSLLGGLRLASQSGPRGAQGQPGAAVVLTPMEQTFQQAARRVASGWSTPIEGSLVRRPAGPALVVRWNQPDGRRAVVVEQEPAGSVAIKLGDLSQRNGGARPIGRIWQRWATVPSEDELVMGLRIAMEEADRRGSPIPPSTPGPFNWN